MSFRFRKGFAATLVVILAVALGAGFLAAPRPARALPVEDIPLFGLQTSNKIIDYITKSIIGAGTVAIVNAMDYFARKVAYDAAVLVASGGKAQGPLFERRGLGDYLKDTALGAAGDALGTLTEQGLLGFNFCNPTGANAPRFRLTLLLGIAGGVPTPRQPRPRCEWSKVAANWKAFAHTYETGEALRQASFAIEPGQSDLSLAFDTNLKVTEESAKRQQNARDEFSIFKGFKAVTEKIAGKVTTPATAVEETFHEKVVSGQAKSEEQKERALSAAFQAGATQVLPAALSTFVNTLSGKLLNKILSKGFFSGLDLTCKGLDSFNQAAGALGAQSLQVGQLGPCKSKKLQNPEFAAGEGEAEARLAFADILTPNIQETNQYDAVTEFTVCPNAFRTVNNCVMESSFAAGVRLAQVDRPITVREAVSQGYLHGDWPLVSDNEEDRARNQDPFCFTNAYCYSNLVKLRKARVLPVGWELAARVAGRITPRATLSDVINGFDKCPSPGQPESAEHRFCHLVDPNWVLKYPQTQCRALVNGPTLISGEADVRSQVCVDTPSCIAEDASGRCVGGWGYCVREKNVWRIGGESCPAEAAGCDTYTREGGTAVSLIATTLDSRSCTAENAGCTAWSTTQDPGDGLGDWISPAARVFLTKNAGSCEARDAGCRELYPKTARRNLILNSSFEDDRDGIPGPDDWRGDVLERSNAPGVATAGEFAIRPRIIGHDLRQTVDIEGDRAYTISFSTKRFAAGAVPLAATVTVSFARADGSAVALDPTFETTCRRVGNQLYLNVAATSETTYNRGECRFRTTPEVDHALVKLAGSVDAPADQTVWVDAVQLEEGIEATSFHADPFAGAAAAYLKAPPDWLGCRGEESDPADCAGYAGVCRADEVGCERYTPTDGSPPVPGIASADDRCPASCVGYAAYRQEPSRFDGAAYPVTFIPRTARSCTAVAAGCTEFTNLEAPAGGGETRAYFSDLRACVKPDAANPDQQTFYTWEGSEVRGYVLKEWRLVAGADGAPALQNPADADGCTRDIFRKIPGEPGYDPDCREFFNAAGAPSYRLAAKTILVSASCTRFRMTAIPGDPAARADTCVALLGSFDAASGDCVFLGIPEASRSCAAAENGCRLYTGNSGRNIRTVFLDTFEGAEGTSGWQSSAAGGVEIVSESVSVGGHSLKTPAAGEITKDVSPRARAPLQAGQTYFLTLWAKGRGNLTASFPIAGLLFGTVPLTETWTRFELGPVRLSGDPAPDEVLSMSGFADRSYLDNIELRAVASSVALIKDSWTTPAICDATNAGAPLPRAQLGCLEYRTIGGATVALKSLSSLCRERSVGCAAYTDSQLSDSPSHETWNALCLAGDAPVNSPTDCRVDGNAVCTVGIGSKSCRYHKAGDAPLIACPGGATSCDIDGVRVEGGKPVDQVIVPKDRTRFLVPSAAASCSAEKAGCELYGTPEAAVCRRGALGACSAADGCPCALTPGAPAVCTVAQGETSCRYALPWREPYPTDLLFREQVVRDVPKSYDRTLCTVPAVSCEEWARPGGSGFSYFKDPGERLCEFREGVAVGGIVTTGWFRKGSDLPCDPTDLISGNQYGIRRNGDAEYAGFAGACRSNFSGCTEFIDPADTHPILYPTGKSYFVIRGGLDTKSCEGKVSAREGCVLFDNTSDPVKKWNARGTYAEATRLGARAEPAEGGCVLESSFRPCLNQLCIGDGLARRCSCSRYGPEKSFTRYGGECTDNTACVTELGAGARCDTTHDANTVVKVRQDRQCGEWLACRGSAPVWDTRANKFKEVCDSVGLCDQYTASGQTAQCSHWVSNDLPDILSLRTYRSRDVGAAGQDYSGYAVPGNYTPDALKQVPVRSCSQDPGTSCASDADCAGKGSCTISFRLAHVIGRCAGADGSACSVGDEDGTCWGKQCSQAISGDLETGTPAPLLLANSETASCRAYPESNSPFPSSVATFDAQGRFQGAQPGFQNAKTCTPGQDCECSYRKLTFGSGVAARYFSRGARRSELPQGICQGGRFDGLPCDPAATGGREESAANGSCKLLVDRKIDEAQSGTCVAKSREDTLEGLDGFCLERDKSLILNGEQGAHACLTWLPTDRLAGSQDIYNSFASAGYPEGNSFLCAVPELTKTVGVGRSICQKPSNCDANSPEYDGPAYLYDAFKLGNGSAVGRASCAPGYFIVMGACKEGGAQTAFGCGGENAPYRCVPIGSKHEAQIVDDPDPNDSGAACDPDNDPAVIKVPRHGYFANAGAQVSDTGSGQDSLSSRVGGDVPIYWIDGSTRNTDSEDEVNVLKRYDDCILKGVPSNRSLFSEEHAVYGLSCSLAVQVSTETAAGGVANKSWTNRLWDGGAYRISAPDAPTYNYNATCTLAAACPLDAGCPCEVNGRNVCAAPIPKGQSSCTYPVPVNPLRYVAATPPSLPPLATFGQTLFTGGDPLREEGPVPIQHCKQNDSPAHLALPLPESRLCAPGYSAGGALRSRPYSTIEVMTLADIRTEADNLNRAAGRIKQLFAKLFTSWVWKYPANGQPGTYAAVGAAGGGIPEQDVSAANGRPPRIFSVGRCDASGRCDEGAEGKITVDGTSSADVRGGGGSHIAALKFFAFADDNQMPLRQIIVDWGDGAVQGPFPGSYKNHRGWSLSGAQPLSHCDNATFGTSRDACDDTGPFTYIHSYTCPPNAPETIGTCAAPGEPNADGCFDTSLNVCIYKPRVQVKDNWGFCNGTCRGNPAGDACYDAFPPGADECSASAGAWTSFANKVIVAPR